MPIHPDTGEPYAWPEEGLADIDISSLPEIDEAMARGVSRGGLGTAAGGAAPEEPQRRAC